MILSLIIAFVIVFLSCPPLIHSATYVNTFKPICPKSFSCPDFSPFTYPFYNTTDTQCGLIKVNCTLGNKSIQLGGHSYQITSKDLPGAWVVIPNNTFQELIENKSCKALMRNITSPTPDLFSISIQPLITLFKCPKDPFLYDARTDVYFEQPNYKSYNLCKHHNIYYQHPISNTSVPDDLPPSCQVIQLPKRRIGPGPNYTDIFSLLTSDFSISFWSPSCNKCLENGHCPYPHEFECSDAMNSINYGIQDEKQYEKQNKKLKVILAITGSAFILIFFTAIFITYRRFKNNRFSYFLSKDKSSNPEDGSLFFGVSIFSYIELKNATKNFDPSHELGDGGFGAVYYGKLQDEREVAVKRLYDHNYKRVQHFVNEVEILTKLRHSHLVLLYSCTSRQSQELLLVYEYIPNGTVADHFHGEHATPGLLTWPIRLKIAIETASALVYLHASEIVHRDVNTNNILLDNNFSVKVADFGI